VSERLQAVRTRPAVERFVGCLRDIVDEESMSPTEPPKDLIK
jgi:hypothetical protein